MKTIKVISVLLIVVGLIIFIFPKVKTWNTERVAKKTEKERQESVKHAQEIAQYRMKYGSVSSSNSQILPDKSETYHLKMGQRTTISAEGYKSVKLYPYGKTFYYQEPGGEPQLVGGSLPVYQTAGISEFYVFPDKEEITLKIVFKN